MRNLTREQRWLLALTSLASFIVILDALVVATALTAIRHGLGASLADLDWTVNAYTLSFAVLLMTAAAVGDRFGRRKMFVAGLALFAVSSAACALAPDIGVLIAARAVQGAGAATIMPMALSMLNGGFPPERRGWAIGIYGSVTGLAAALGPLLGGAVTQGLGWQWIFWMNVPIALVAIPFVLTRIGETPREEGRVDMSGLALVTVAALGVVWGLVRANTVGWGSAETVVALAVGVAAVAAFVAWQRRATAPMLPLRLFRSRAFTAGNAAIFFLNASMIGIVFFMPQFQQVVMGHGPLGAGLRMLPWGVAPLLVAPRAGALADRVGERVVVTGGMLMQAAGIAWIALVAAPSIGYGALILPMCVTGIGFALAIPVVTRAATSTVPRAEIGKASGAYSTMRQLGGAFGVAVVSAAFASDGAYGSAAAFSRGFSVAFGVAAAMALAGAVAGAWLPGRRPAPTSRELGRPLQRSAG